MSARLTRPASRDLDEISSHIAADDPAAALRVLDRLQRAIQRIGTHPRSGHVRADLGLPMDIRFVTVAPYLVAYECRRRIVVVLRVLHAARNVSSVLGTGDESDE